MLLDLSMVLILCGKLLRKWASEFEWGMWRNIEWGIGIGVTAVGVLRQAMERKESRSLVSGMEIPKKYRELENDCFCRQ